MNILFKKPRYILIHILLTVVLLVSQTPLLASEIYQQWQAKDFAIEKPLAKNGNVQRGRSLVIRRDKGNCLACHALPISEEGFHGTLGPPLLTVADRLTAAQLRLRIVDQQSVNPVTVMPSFYKNPLDINRVGQDYIKMTILTAQEVEDVIAYLLTLRQEASK